MPVGLPAKTTYANGDVFSASDINDTNGTINITAAPFAAGKNKVINGDFFVNQRAFSTTTSNDVFTVDRWKTALSGGTVTTSIQNFTLGAAPVAGYESKQHLQIVSSGQSASGNFASTRTFLESVRTLAGQTATLSFWAKAASGTPKIGLTIEQRFGSGGSPSADVLTVAAAQTISTSWARYSFTVNIPSISGKTIGTVGDDYLGFFIFTSCGTGVTGYSTDVGVQNATIGIWGVQLEAGSNATGFQTATGTITGELALCQRYYQRFTTADAYSILGWGSAQSGTQAKIVCPLPVTMRTKPASIDYSTLGIADGGAAIIALTALALEYHTNQQGALLATVASGTTANRPVYLFTNNSATAFLGFSAEL
jgi:hypothetical protein